MPDGLAAMAMAVGVIAGVAAVEHLLVRLRSRWAFMPAVALPERLVPIARAPTGEGVAGGIRWWVDDGVVRFAGMAGRGRVRGTATLRPARGRGCALDVAWTPGWTLPTALAVLAVRGATLGEGAFAGTIAAGLLGVHLIVGWRTAASAAAVLRQGLVLAAEKDA